MNKLDVFALTSGLIGLVVDLIAIVTLFLGFWGGLENSANCGASCGYGVLVILLLPQIYAWFALGWYVARKGAVTLLLLTETGEKRSAEDMVAKSVAAVGFVILPVYAIWLFAASAFYVESNPYYYVHDGTTAPMPTRIASGENLETLPGTVDSVDRLSENAIPLYVSTVRGMGIAAYVITGVFVYFAVWMFTSVMYPRIAT